MMSHLLFIAMLLPHAGFVHGNQRALMLEGAGAPEFHLPVGVARLHAPDSTEYVAYLASDSPAILLSRALSFAREHALSCPLEPGSSMQAAELCAAEQLASAMADARQARHSEAGFFLEAAGLRLSPSKSAPDREEGKHESSCSDREAESRGNDSAEAEAEAEAEVKEEEGEDEEQEGVGGAMLYLTPIMDTMIGRSLETIGGWEQPASALLRALVGRGDVVVDVGANVGAHALPLAAAVGRSGRVHALEPQVKEERARVPRAREPVSRVSRSARSSSCSPPTLR